MRHAAGLPLPISHGPYAAEVVTVGACLRTLTHHGVDLVAGSAPGAMCADFRGAVLMPWPNRVIDGRYDFAGETHQLPLSEPAARNALHGLAHWVPWTVVEQEPSRVLLRHELAAQPGYPWQLDLEVDHALRDDGLTTTLRATNVGDRPAPYGTGMHPYLTVGRRVDECVLTLPASTWCAMDERGRPAAPVAVGGTAYDFRAARPIGELVLDHPFGGVVDGATATLTDPDSGRAVHLTVHQGLGWLHVFTGDTIEDGGARRSLAVEPTTAPPDAFRSGTDLVVLEPGATHAASFTIAAGAAG